MNLVTKIHKYLVAASGLDAGKVLLGNQNAPKPAPIYIVYKIINQSRILTIDHNSSKNNDGYSHLGQVRVGVQLDIFGDANNRQTFTDCENLKARIINFRATQEARKQNILLQFVEVTSAFALPKTGIIGARYVPQEQIEMLCQCSLDYQENLEQVDEFQSKELIL